MRDFSIDLAAEQIQSSKTREYFKEVIRSYYSENYRSAIVMLYSVAQTDLILKLAELQDVYNDPIAKTILDDIAKLQKESSSKSDWETKLVKWVHDRTELLDQADYLNMTNLQQQRHLCAHPVISEGLDLYSPNRETVRALIRNTLEGVLMKPAILSRKVFDSILIDLDKNKRILLTREDLKLFLETKYFNKLRDASIQKIFESLWKITFTDLSPKSVENRGILVEVIKILLNRNFGQLKPGIISKADVFSVVNESLYFEVIDVLNEFSELFTILNSEFQLLLKKHAATSGNLTAFAWFLNGNIQKHVQFLCSRKFSGVHYAKDTHVDDYTLTSLMEICEKIHSNELANSLVIHFALNSRSYYDADERFDLILDRLPKFTLTDFQKIINGYDLNSQVSGRSASRYSVSKIKKHILAIDPDFDFTASRAFQQSA